MASDANFSANSTLQLAKGRLTPLSLQLGLRSGDVLELVDGQPFRGDLTALRRLYAGARGQRLLGMKRGEQRFSVLTGPTIPGHWDVIEAPADLQNVAVPADPDRMSNWLILRNPHGQHDLYAQGPTSIMAMILPVVWLLQKRLWLPAAAVVSALAVAMAVSPWAAFVVYMAAGWNLQKMGAAYQRSARLAAGFRPLLVLAAPSEMAAIAAYRVLDPAASFVFAPAPADVSEAAAA